MLQFFAVSFAFCSNAVELDSSNFAQFIKENPVSLVNFFAPWCHFCTELAPHYQSAAYALLHSTPQLKIATVDCTKQQTLCQQQVVNYYPTLKVFKAGQPSIFQGQRSEASIIFNMKKSLIINCREASPIVSEVSGDKLNEFISSSKVAVVGYFDPHIVGYVDHDGEEKPEQSFSMVSSGFKFDGVVFGKSTSIIDMEAIKVKAPAVVLFKNEDGASLVYEGDFSYLSVLKFVKDNSFSLLEEYDISNEKHYAERGLPIASLFYIGESQKVLFEDGLKALAKKYENQVSFVFVNAAMVYIITNDQYPQHAVDCLLTSNIWPAFTIIDGNAKFPMPQDTELFMDDIEIFVRDEIHGRINPSIKSAAIPENNNDPVTVVVGNSFNDIVLNREKNVFVNFYAPWW
jgi:protein disulfide-isomerase A1